MDYVELLSYHEKILDSVISRKLKISFDLLEKLDVIKTDADLEEKYDIIQSTYLNMLKYSFGSVPDPKRESIYLKLQQSILELSDEIKDKISRQIFFGEYQHYNMHSLDLKSLSAHEILQVNYKLQLDNEEQTNEEINAQLRTLFYSLILSNVLKEPEKYLISEVIKNDKTDWKVKSVLISSITMSLLRHFDSEKISILFDLSKNEHPEIRQRALIGLFLGLLVYQKRLIFYGEIISRLRSIPDDTAFQEGLLEVFIQYLKSRETEKITRKIQDEIVPEVLKMRSELEERFNLDELMTKESFEDKNPEWENLFKDSPDVYQKLEQFSQMQGEGSDVFMGAFALLKNFNFFHDMANWFLPFDGNNFYINEAFQQIDDNFDKKVFLEGLEESGVLCNSDKYSFCFNIQHMSAQQRKMMIDLFNMEMSQLNEIQSDAQKLNREARNKIINAQYFQDLYRFYKLNEYSKEFLNIFSLSFDIVNSEILRIVFDNKKIIKNIAEFYFAKDDFTESLKLFNWLNFLENSFELIEKIGFCYQKLGDFAHAIELYKQAELYDRNRLWLHKKLGYCYRKTGEFENAIEQYILVIKEEPNDLNNLVYIGKLYMDSENYEEALKYLYRVEYEATDKSKAYRPIAWCSFILDKFDNAIKYYLKLVQNKPTEWDFLNLGHCYWASGKITEAIEAYQNALAKSNRNENWFRKTFYDDVKYFSRKNIDEFEVALMIDFILLKTD